MVEDKHSDSLIDKSNIELLQTDVNLEGKVNTGVLSSINAMSEKSSTEKEKRALFEADQLGE